MKTHSSKINSQVISLLACVALTASLAIGAEGKEYRVSQAIESGDQAFRRGEVEDARKHYEAARQALPLTGAQEARAIVSERLGVLSARTGSLDEAYRHFEEGLSVLSGQGVDAPELHVSLLHALGALLLRQGKSEIAETRLEEALDVARQGAVPPDRRRLAAVHRTLAVVAWKRHSLAEGDRHAGRATMLWKAVLSGKSLVFAAELEALGRAALACHALKAAARHLEKALGVREAILGAKDQGLLANISALSETYARGKSFARAIALVLRGLAIVTEQVGVDDPSRCEWLLRLVSLHERAGSRQLARTRLQETLSLYQRTYGSEHYRLERIRKHYADLLAEGVPGRAKRVRPRCPSDRFQACRAQRQKGATALSEGDFDRASTLFEGAALSLAEYEGVDSLWLVCAMGAAYAYKGAGDLSAAERWFRQSLWLFEEARGIRDPMLGQLLESYGEVLSKLGRISEAAAVLERALLYEIEASSGPGQLLWHVSRLNREGETAHSAGQVARARARFETAVSIAGQNGLLSAYAKSLANYAMHLEATDGLEQAWPIYLQAEGVFTRAVKGSSPEQRAFLLQWANACWRCGREEEALVRFDRVLSNASDNPAAGLEVFRRVLLLCVDALSGKRNSLAQRGAHFVRERADSFEGLSGFSAAALLVLGRSFEVEGDIEKAVSAYKEAHARYRAADGCYSPGVIAAELLWLGLISRNQGGKGAAAVSRELRKGDRAKGAKPPKLDGAWVALFETLGGAAVLDEIQAAYGRAFERTSAGPGRLLILRALTREFVDSLLPNALPPHGTDSISGNWAPPMR